MFIDQRKLNALMRELGRLREDIYDSCDPGAFVIAKRLDRIKKMLTDQSLAPTAVPE